MSAFECAIEIRRGLLMIASALLKYKGWPWLRVILTGEDAKPCQGKIQPGIAPRTEFDPQTTDFVRD
jgi:hypothetical protein